MTKYRFVAPLLFLAGVSTAFFGGSSPAVAQGNPNNDFEQCLRICSNAQKQCNRGADSPGEAAQCKNSFRVCERGCEREN